MTTSHSIRGQSPEGANHSISFFALVCLVLPLLVVSAVGETKDYRTLALHDTPPSASESQIVRGVLPSAYAFADNLNNNYGYAATALDGLNFGLMKYKRTGLAPLTDEVGRIGTGLNYLNTVLQGLRDVDAGEDPQTIVSGVVSSTAIGMIPGMGELGLLDLLVGTIPLPIPHLGEITTGIVSTYVGVAIAEYVDAFSNNIDRIRHGDVLGGLTNLYLSLLRGTGVATLAAVREFASIFPGGGNAYDKTVDWLSSSFVDGAKGIVNDVGNAFKHLDPTSWW